MRTTDKRGGDSAPSSQAGASSLFDLGARQRFLEGLEATSNVEFAAEQAGVNFKTALSYKAEDRDFAAAWDSALAKAFERLKVSVAKSTS